ncbi:TetR family transcriptional regulator [Streptomyces sp. NRRL B-1677]|uniref:TetR/AcrR family transcriptional regulator n=1 Tax=Streptomyces klenkii TaxID=1420899 RepID=A0A3B0ARG5_9ACTN|nr:MULTISPECIES: TetR/AcrR family transcriptional regulator [Streptomyces]MBF6045303.1 TetR family transcriptional regulator [Streptomyces sp. NRRL B-1677]RKN63029.1 TetR/AcrR family transcriptional regulator [Streptomyces klenkii]
MTVDTKERLIRAADTVLRTQGYAKSSARTIAKEAGVNSALVFYHFGGVDPLLFAALDRSSAERMELLAEAVAGARTLEDLVDAGTRVYRSDIEAGHLTLFSELVAAAVAKPELREEIRVRAEPWIAFVEQTLERVIGGTPLARLTPPRDLANAAITFYLGVNLFTVLDSDRSRTESVFAMARRLAPRARLLTRRLPGLGAKRRAHD